jgi:hypothetical protein
MTARQYFKCPFHSTLIARDFGCQHAIEVTRREGPDAACGNATAHQACTRFFAALRGAAVPAFGVADDLTVMPHSVLVKIQFGGLLGLQRLMAREAQPDKVDNVTAVVMQATEFFDSLDGIPYQDLLPDITGYKLRRRR